MSFVAVAVAGTAAIAGGVASYMANQSANDRQQALQNGELQNLINVTIPDPAQQKIALQQFVLQGTMTPQLEQAFKQSPSALQNVRTDARQKAAQIQSLNQLQDIGSQGGLRLQDKSALQDAMLKGQVQNRGNVQAIEQNAASRGQGGGGGFALQAQLQAQQGQSDQNARSGLSAASDAQNRALQAIMQSGQLAGQMRGQDFGEQAAKAQAADAINRFNTQNAQSVSNSNVAASNAAQAQNLAAKQNIASQNTNQANYQQEYNKSLAQQQFNNQLGLANAKNGVYQQLGQNALQQGQQQGNLYSNLGQAGAGAAAGIGQAYFWDDYFNKQKKQSGDNSSGSAPNNSAPANFDTGNYSNLGS